MPVTHTFVNPKSDGADTTIVRPSDWNAEHSGTPDTAHSKQAVRAATNSALSAHTRSGNVLTASANAALTIDGVFVVNTNRVLVKDQGTLENGIYTVTDAGSVSTPWILTRATDLEVDADANGGMTVAVRDGTTNGLTIWMCTNQAAITINTTVMTWEPIVAVPQFSGAITSQASTGDLTAISVDGTGRYRWTGSTATTIHGIAGGQAGRVVLIENVNTTRGLLLANESATEGTAANRIQTPGSSWGMVIPPNTSVQLVYDSTSSRWRAESAVMSHGTPGWVYPAGIAASDTGTTTNLAAAGGCRAVQFHLAGFMRMGGISLWNTDTATARSWEFGLYYDQLGLSNTLKQVVGATGSESFTPSAASLRNVATAALTNLMPGVYWLVIRNTHATSTLGVSCVAEGTLTGAGAERNSTGVAALGSTIDISAWSNATSITLCRLNGRIGAESGIF